MADIESKTKQIQGIDNMPDNDRKEIIIHLQMIQNIIERMARCSFWIKGWTIAVVVAVLASTFKIELDGSMYYFVIPIVGLWLLDSYYLWQERMFRGTYDTVRIWSKTDFAMKPDFTEKYWRVVYSKTIFLFYGCLCLLIVIVVYNATKTNPFNFILKEICNG